MPSPTRTQPTSRPRPVRKPVNGHGDLAPVPRKEKWLAGDSEWEAMKAMRGNHTHDEGVQECAFLSTRYRKMSDQMSKVIIELDAILAALTAKKIPFVLTGAHGISGWTGRPRATHDVDILVKSGRNHARAVKVIRDLYPQLEERRFTGLTAFFPPGEKDSVIEIAHPQRRDNAETLATGIWIEERNLRYRIPTLEAALANKYGAMLTPTRDPGKRGMDGVDFYNMVKHSLDEGREPIDLTVLESLGEMVWPNGGGKEILRVVEEAKAGKVPNLLS